MHFQNPVKNCVRLRVYWSTLGHPFEKSGFYGRGPRRQFKWLSERNLVRTGHVEAKRNGEEKASDPSCIYEWQNREWEGE